MQEVSTATLKLVALKEQQIFVRIEFQDGVTERTLEKTKPDTTKPPRWRWAASGSRACTLAVVIM